jgi:hypothetical protein
MSEDKFREFLSRMPEIAAAVNAFQSEAAQRVVVEALIRELGLHAGVTTTAEISDATDQPKNSGNLTRNRHRPAQPASRKKTRRPGPTLLKDLDLRPANGKSWREFATEKNPTSTRERSIVALYYLRQILTLGAVGSDHIYTCFKDMGWKLPTDFNNHLQVVAKERGWLNTAEMSDIGLTSRGENFVEHDLPRKAQA